MKFYSRQINSLKELKAEQARLKASLADRPLGFGTATSGHTDNSSEGGFDLSFLLSILSNDIVKRALLKLGLPVLKNTAKFAGKNAFALGKEIFGGYAKWKLLELGFRFARRKWQEKKHHKES